MKLCPPPQLRGCDHLFESHGYRKCVIFNRSPYAFGVCTVMSSEADSLGVVGATRPFQWLSQISETILGALWCLFQLDSCYGSHGMVAEGMGTVAGGEQKYILMYRVYQA